MPAFGSFCSTS